MKLRLSRFWAGAFWLCLMAVSALALLPDPDGDLPSSGWDKGNHLLAFATLAGLALQAFPRRKQAIVPGLALYGGLIEILQALTPYRQAEWRDFLADALGAVLGLVLAAGLRRQFPRLASI